jgi:predicted ATPase
MLQHLSVKRFKSLVSLELDLGRINVFIGANGSGKSNILEAVGVLGAAAFGRVDDEALLRRGVRPGVPRLYKTAFHLTRKENLPHIFFGARSESGAEYEVTLRNPLNNPNPAWQFNSEILSDGVAEPFERKRTRGKHNKEQGMVALQIVDFEPNDPRLILMDQLRNYSIYCPNTPSLRGLIQDMQTREPVGLAGGRLPEAVGELLSAAKNKPSLNNLLDEVLELIDWAKDFSWAPSVSAPLSPSAARSSWVVEFVDRYMDKYHNSLTGYDASEGALYILYCAVLALHPKSPRCLAVDNVDQTLNPRLAKKLMEALCNWTQALNGNQQWLLTVHNPAILDGLPLDKPDVRLFAVNRDGKGHTTVRPIDLKVVRKARRDKTWTLSRMWMNGLLGAVPNV